MRRPKRQGAGEAVLSLLLVASLMLNMVPTSAIAEAMGVDTGATEEQTEVEAEASEVSLEDLQVQLEEAVARAEELSAEDEEGSASAVQVDETASDLTYIDDENDYWNGYYYTSVGATGEADADTGRAAGVYVELDDEGNATIAKACGTVTAYEVPAELDGHPVVAIGGGAFGTSASGSAVTEFRPLASLSFAAGSHLEEIGSGAFGTTLIESVALPDSVKTIAQDAFYYCPKLASVTWPSNAGFTEVNGFQCCNALTADVIASLPTSVTAIGENAFSSCFGLTEIALPPSVQTVGRSAFECCQNATSITLNEGLTTIGARAFASCYAMEGATVTLPRSLGSLPNDVFKNDHSTSGGGAWTQSHSAVTLRVLNPDFALTDESYYDYDDQVTIDGTEYTNPFDVGQTIVAYKTDSAGNPSAISKLAALLADEKDPYDESGATPAYTFEWFAATAKLTGSVPAGASVRISQDGQAVSATVDEKGVVAADAERGKAVTVRVSLDGYYDYYRTVDVAGDAASADFGAVTVEDMTALPVSGSVALNVQAQSLAADGTVSTSAYTGLAAEGISLSVGGRTLEQGVGKDYAVSGGALVIYEAAGLTRDDELTLTVTPDASSKLSPASADFKIDDEKVEVTLAAWGMARISCDGDFAGNDRVYIFRNDLKVDEGLTAAVLVDPAGSEATAKRFETAQLEAGSYTAVAVNQTGVTFKVNSLASLTRMGFVPGQNCARADFTIEDGKVCDLTLDVPTFDATAYAQAAGVNHASVVVSSRSASPQTELTASVQTELAEGVSGRMTLELPEDCMDGLWVGDASTGSNAGTSIDLDAHQVTLDLSGTNLYELRFKPGESGTHVISASVSVGSNTFPVSSASFEVYDLMVVPATYSMTTKTGRATVYAKPFLPVELEVEGGQTFAGTTNAYGRAYIDFTLPDDVYPSQRVTLTAKMGEKTAQAGIAFLGGISVEDFAVTNSASGTIHPFSDGAQSDEWMTVLYHKADEKNAYWSFDLLLNKPDGLRETPDTLNLTAVCLDDATYDILLTKQSEDDSTVRYVGERVDEKYLEALREYEENGEKGDLDIGNGAGFFLPESFSLDSSLICGTTSFDVTVSAEKYAKEATEEREQAIRDAQAEFQASCDEFDTGLRGIWDIIIEETGGNTDGSFDELIGTIDQLYTEAGDADGNTVEDYFFGDDLSLDSDSSWLDDIVSADYGDAEANAAAQKLASLISRYNKLAEEAKTDICSGLNIPGSLSDYKDMNEVAEKTFEQMKGVEVKDRSQVDTSGYTQAGTSGLYKLDEQPVGSYMGVEGMGVASSDAGSGADQGDEGIAIETEFTENAWGDAWDAGYSNLEAGGLLSIDEFTALFNSTGGRKLIRGLCLGNRERAMSLYKALRHLKGYKVVVEGMGEAYKFSLSKAVSGTVGTGIAINGVRKTSESNVSIVSRIAEEEGNLEILKNMLSYQLAKNPPNVACIQAIRHAMSIEESYIELLKQERFNNNADMVVGSCMAVLGFVASVTTGGVGGIFLAEAGPSLRRGLQRGPHEARHLSRPGGLGLGGRQRGDPASLPGRERQGAGVPLQERHHDSG